MSITTQHIIAFVIMQFPWMIEIAFDSVMWYFIPKDGSDKPWSTWIVRPLAMAGSTWAAVVVGGVAWFYVLPLVITFFGLIFPLVINWILGKPWYYVSETDNKWAFDYWAKKMHDWPYLWLRVWLVITFITLYFW